MARRVFVCSLQLKSNQAISTPQAFSRLCEECQPLRQPLLHMREILSSQILNPAVWRALSQKREAMSCRVFVVRHLGGVVLEYTPKEDSSWITTEPITSYDQHVTEHIDILGSSSRGERVLLDAEEEEGEEGEDHSWARTALPLVGRAEASREHMSSTDRSREDSELCSQSDIKLRSRESNCSSAGAVSDISSLTAFSRNNSNSSDFNVLPPGSPRASLVQISRCAKRPSDTSTLSAAAPQVASSLCSNPRHDTTAHAPSGETPLAVSKGAMNNYPEQKPRNGAMVSSPRHERGPCAPRMSTFFGEHHRPQYSPGTSNRPSAQHPAGTTNVFCKPPRSVLPLSKAKVVPVDVRAEESSEDAPGEDDDTIDGALGWTKTSQGPKRHR